MKFKAKLRQIGNSQGIYIPLKVITGYTLGEEIGVEVITKEETKEEQVITKGGLEEKPVAKVITPIKKSSKLEFCSKHKGSLKITCGCH